MTMTHRQTEKHHINSRS